MANQTREDWRQILLDELDREGGIRKELDTRVELSAGALAGALAQAWPKSGRQRHKYMPTFAAIHVSRKKWPLTRYVVIPFPGPMVEYGHLSRSGKFVPPKRIAAKTVRAMSGTIKRIMNTGV